MLARGLRGDVVATQRERRGAREDRQDLVGIAHDDAPQEAVLAQLRDEREESPDEPLGGCVVDAHLRVDVRDQPSRFARDERREQRVAVCEAAVQRRAADTRARGDVVERRAPQAVRRELLARGLEDPLGVRVELVARAGDEVGDRSGRAHAARAARASRSKPARAIGM